MPSGNESTLVIPPQKAETGDPQAKLVSETSHIGELYLDLIESPSSVNMADERSRARLQPWAESLSLSCYADSLDHSAHSQGSYGYEHEAQLQAPVAKTGL